MEESPTKDGGDEAPSEDEDFLLKVARGSARGADSAARDLEPELSPDFLGPEAGRFEIRRRLGQGGFGTVYEVFDRERNAHVALKTMTRHDPRAIYRFKQEFRALADLAHPNLVELHELHGHGQRWFFTMELVPGLSAHTYVQAAERPSPAGHAFDEVKLRSVLRQIAEGLCFLHESGRLHRDIKPSNVMVTPEGRAVLLDFGLILDLTLEGDHSVGGWAGTPRYMAPEQATTDPIGPAADWYAVGVMLYEALTGRPPFDGAASPLLRRKLSEDPRPPDAGVPEDLSRLCMDLLNRSPALRPSGREVKERLASHQDREAAPPPRSREPAHAAAEGAKVRASFIGRAAELGQLHTAFAMARAGGTAVTLVRGRSGMGKSALIARFLDDLREVEPAAVLLAGRCFEQESVPYKALDSAVDALGRHLRRMSEAEVNAILPRDIATLARLFPALLRIPAVESAPRRAEGQDQLTQRRRAFGALRELFARLGDRTSLALVIDDLQWGDADSSALLLELLRPPDAPRMLVVLAYRADEAERSECLRALLPALHATTMSALALSEVAVEELGEAEARELALSELAGDGAAEPSPDRAAMIVSEAGGSPFFIRELCRTEGAIDGAQPSLDAMLRARIASLPEEPRRLLEMIAVAGKPIERGIAMRAAALGDGGPSTLVLLRKDRLVRMLRDRSRDEIEAYHDRIREAVMGRLAAETKKGHHLALAAALLDAGDADEETLAVHFEGAGEAAKAAEHAVKAADQAMAALGFDRAARLYRQAIASMREDDAEMRALHEKLGAALGNAGRGPEAAAAYLAAVDVSVAERALTLRRRAAEHYLTSGHLEEGLSVLRAVLAATGLSMPATRLGALIRLLPLVALLWLRGLRFRERPEHEIPAEDLLRIDACAAVASGLMSADPLLSMCFHKRFLWLSLRAGDPYRVVRALIVEAGFYAAVGASEIPSRKAERIERVMLPLLERLREPRARFQALQGAVEAMRGSSLMFRGQFRQAREHLERALAGLTGYGVLGNEVALTSMFLVQMLFVLGEWREAFRRQAAFLEEARARGDLFLEVTLSQHSYVSALMEDRPDAACEVIERAKTQWPRADPSRHYVLLMAESMTALYRDAGVGDGALLLAAEAWPALTRSGLITFSASARTAWLYLRGRASLAAAAGAPPSRRPGLLRAASRDARALGRIRLRVAAAGAASLRAGVAAGQGDRDRALALLAEAEASFLALDMALDVAASRRRRGELLGAEDGRALIASADAVMAAQDIRNPARMTAMFLPGKW